MNVNLGTGKTFVGILIAYQYVLMNRYAPVKAEDKTKPLCLYCGPSNQSVDVVAGITYYFNLHKY